MRLAPRAAWVALPLIIAGCTGSSPASMPEPTLDVLFTDETGGLAGTITNDALEPLPEASVILDGQTTEVTGAHGEFSFALLAPGDHVVAISKEGYADAATNVAILAGEVTTIRVLLVSHASVLPYHETKTMAGLIGCGAAVGANGIAVTPAVCGVQDTAGASNPAFNRHVTDLQLGSVGPDWIGFWLETSWTSTQALGSRMTINWWAVNVPIGTTGRVSITPANSTLRGPSPLATHFLLKDVQGDVNSTVTGAHGICRTTCILSAGHFAAPDGVGAAGIGVGATLQQRFDDYVTVFHYGSLPDSFSALADS